MKKRVFSLLLAAAISVSALAGCGSESNSGKSESVTDSEQSEVVTSSPLHETDSGKTVESAPSGIPDETSEGRNGDSKESTESHTDSTESTGYGESGGSQNAEEASEIARMALEQLIRQRDTVEYSYMNTVTCRINEAEITAETANHVKAYGKEDFSGSILTVNKVAEMRSGSQVVKRGNYWYDQDGNVYTSEYDDAAGSYSAWRPENYGSGMTWMNETGLEVYEQIYNGNIRPAVTESSDGTDSPDGTESPNGTEGAEGKNHILYFKLNGEQTRALFGRLFDDISFNGALISLSDAQDVEVRVVVTKKSYQPYALSIKAAEFISNGILVSDYDISLAYLNWSTSETPLEIPQEIVEQTADPYQ